MSKTQRRVACVTGGSKGIGFASVRRFLQAGYQVVYCGRNQDDLDRSSAELEKCYAPDLFYPVCADVSSETDMLALFTFIKDRFTGLDCLVANAAVIEVKILELMPLSTMREQFDVNVFGVISCIQKALPLLRERQGCIVTISSLAGIKGLEKFSGFSTYTMTKSAIVGLTENLAVELADDGIRVNCLAPGAVKTEMLAKAAPGLETSTLPGDIAQSIFFLADPEQSARLTGTILEVHSNG